MVYFLVFLLITSILILAPSRRGSLFVTGFLVLFVVVSSGWTAISALSGADGFKFSAGSLMTGSFPLMINCDKLSAFFILVINFTVLSGFIYSIGYLEPYIKKKPAHWIKLHYLAFVWLHASMVTVPLLRNGISFLIAWEVMTLSSFVLVIFDYEERRTISSGINYLIQMHVGMLFILAAFIISGKGSGTISFDSLSGWFAGHSNWPVFLLFFIGFGLKAGFFLLHTWLPDAHPAAPSHVSGIMSGVMIKLGIYGIIRVVTYLQSDLAAIGASVMIISGITGLFGVMMAILQHDVKKLLAYHSIENIGIIGLGIGLGIYGTALDNPIISVAGFAGALLHTLNHSLFKSLLFYSAGSAISKVHTRNVEKMGGLMRYMPLTAWAFLIGSVAIAGLPPFNGFISEFLIYTSLFEGISHQAFYPMLTFFVSMVMLVLIGGLAIFCFTKVFGIVFLGHSRTSFNQEPSEVKGIMLSAKLMPVLLIVLIGFLPSLIMDPILQLSGNIFRSDSLPALTEMAVPMKYISISGFVLLLLTILIFALRRLMNNGRPVLNGPTWGCGYTAGTPKQQYTATSFIQEYADLVKPLIKTGSSKIDYHDDEIFPGKRDFHTHTDDFIRSWIILRPADFIIRTLRKAALFQTGKLQHYVLYALLFLLIIFILTFFEIL